MKNCSAFHFYLLDPGAPNNCWAWTKDYYIADGSDKAYCFVKQDPNIVEDWNALEDEVLFSVEEEKEESVKDATRGPKPTKSLNDYDLEYEKLMR